MMRSKYGNFRKALVVIAVWLSAMFFSVVQTQAQDYNPTQVIVQLNSPNDLIAVADQYHLNRTPLGSFGSPAFYLLQIIDTQTPPQVVTADRKSVV